MSGLQITMSRELGGWPLYTIVIATGQVSSFITIQIHILKTIQMLSATSFQITLLTGRNWQDDVSLYVLGGVFLAATAVWYPMFRIKPSVYVISLPWVFFGLAFLIIGIPSVHPALAPAHRALSNAATWCYAIASAAGFLFFGLNFGEEAVCLLSWYQLTPLTIPLGCCNRGLDASGMCCAGITADLGRCSMVLGLSTQRTPRWLHCSLVDSLGSLATSFHQLLVCIPYALRLAWSVEIFVCFSYHC